MAQWECEKISERTKTGMSQGIIQGKYSVGGKDPFGYERSKDGILVLSSIGRKWIPYIFNKFVDERYSIIQLVHHLNGLSSEINWLFSKVKAIFE